MSIENLFEGAVRAKYRFPFRGVITTEDLWDLSLQDLDRIFKTLNAAAKQTQEESLLKVKDEHSEILERKIEIIKHIVSVKQAEAEAVKDAANRKAQKQRILEIIAKKEDDALENMPLNKLKEMADGM
jgi:orotate phosphoribosyltransferase-like protein